MRIIGGKYRGRRLISFDGKDVRPTIDRVKESIFNVIQFDIANCRFVDLFSGTGSIGIEAISRGAKEVIFSDISQKSLNIVKENLKGIDGEYKIYNKDFKDALRYIDGVVDFIFIDAPYALDCIEDIIKIVKDRNLLSLNGYIIYEHDNLKKYELSKDFYIAKQKTFGNVVVDYIKIVNSICAVTGSFDPITNGHVGLIKEALNHFNKVLLVIAQNEEKQKFFSLEQRKIIASYALQEYNNVNIAICDKYMYEYLNELNINVIVRGFRDDDDYKYEMNMAEYNKEHGNIETILYKAYDEDVSISSTKIRNMLQNNEDIKKMVPKGTDKIIKKFYEENIKND